MPAKLKIESLKMTTDFCPTQWEGETEDGRPVYIRYRWGHLTVNVGERGEDPVYGKLAFEKYAGPRWCGVMTSSELRRVVRERVILPRSIGG